MRLRIDTKHMSQPEGGWSYQIPDGPLLSCSKVGGPGLADLIEQILEYRQVNGMPLGDPEHDICLIYRERVPWLILTVEDEDVCQNDAEAWIHRVWKSCPLQLGEPRARDDRFAQCEKCVHFEPLDATELSEEAERRLALLNPAKFHVEHGWCLLRGWIPSVACQIQQPIELADEKCESKDCWVDTSKK